MQHRDALFEVRNNRDGSVRWYNVRVIAFVMCNNDGLMAVIEDLDGSVSATPAKNINLMSIDEEDI